MAQDVPGLVISQEAAADLSALQYAPLVKTTVSNRVDKTAADTSIVIGFLQNKPNAAGRAATVMVNGVTRAVASAAVAAGDQVCPDGTTGKVKTATTGDRPCGIALDSAAADLDYVSVLILSQSTVL